MRRKLNEKRERGAKIERLTALLDNANTNAHPHFCVIQKLANATNCESIVPGGLVDVDVATIRGKDALTRLHEIDFFLILRAKLLLLNTTSTA